MNLLHALPPMGATLQQMTLHHMRFKLLSVHVWSMLRLATD